MIKKRTMTQAASVLVAAVLVLTGCNGNTEQKTGNEAKTGIDSQALATDIQKKYGSSEAQEYGDPIQKLGRDESIFINIEFDPAEKGMENYTDIVQLYQDPQLTQVVGTHFDIDKETGEIEIKPPKYEPLCISNYGLSKNEFGMEDSEYTLFEKEECKDWGNLGKMYMVQKVDLKTGETLEKPVVTVVTVAGELDAPQLSFQETEEGLAAFTWNEVKGAKKYFIGEMDYSVENGFTGNVSVIGDTKETYWEAEALKGDVVFNSKFNTYATSEDEWNNPSESMQQYLLEQYGEENRGKAVRKSDDYITYYGVFAVCEDGISMVSNRYSEDELASLLVYSEALYSGDEKRTNYAEEGIMSAQSYRWVVMCDGRTVQKLINYDIDAAEETTRQYGTYEEEDMSDLELVDVEVVEIPYTIDGTPLEGTMIVENYEEGKVDDDLKALQERQENLRSKTGNINIDIDEDYESEADQEAPAKLESEVQITANSALSEYLAVNMLSGVEMIDLGSFKQSSDREYLVDALNEARYQNPLILGLSNIGISNDGKYLYIEYEDDTKTRQKKQKEIQKEVDKVIEDIITEDMTDLEKEYAINQYLCDSAEYDMKALENAEQYDYYDVDEEFYDSFTPYGVLVNKVGVCASYAGAFKMLADAAGIESIVVTGYLDGSLSHAWNRVNIDGKWQTIDSTNNDMEELPNALLNLSDEAASAALVEDKEYVMDTSLSQYISDTDESEYYRLANKYYDLEEVTDALAAGLNEDGKGVLRTSYDLNDEVFAQIVTGLQGKSDRVPTEGYYWLGVIYLSE